MQADCPVLLTGEQHLDHFPDSHSRWSRPPGCAQPPERVRNATTQPLGTEAIDGDRADRARPRFPNADFGEAHRLDATDVLLGAVTAGQDFLVVWGEVAAHPAALGCGPW